MLQTLLQVPPLLLPDEHELAVVEFGKPREDRAIVADRLVAMQLDELVEQQLDVVERLRPGLMAGHLDDVPGGEVLEDLPLHARHLDAHLADGVLGCGSRIRFGFELLEPGLQLIDLALERKWSE